MKLYIETGEAIPAVKVQKDADPAPSGFDAATDDVTLWDKHGPRVLAKTADGLPGVGHFRDYKKLRSEIGARIYTKAGFDPKQPATFTQTNWDLLTAAEKEIAARYFLVPPEGVASAPLRDEIYTTDQQISLGMDHHRRSVAARELRTLRALVEVYNRLAISDAMEIEEELNQIPVGSRVETDANNDTISKVKVKALIRSFRDRGLEGTAEDSGKVGLFDYVLSRANTPFAGNGMSTKGFTVRGMADCAALATRVHDILAQGLY